MEKSAHIQRILDSIPAKTGVYLMKNDKGEIIYVGKAVNLRNRVRSYFHLSAQEHHKTKRLVSQIADIEWILVGSELEALILEMNLIKKHRPFFNVRLKDDKRYPYIKIHWASPFPKVTITRRIVNDGSRYYGPYTSVWAVTQTLHVLRRVFPYLTCDREITGKDKRACLYYDIKLCSAPCIGAISKEDYRRMISYLGKFLEGRTDDVVKQLKEDMKKESDALRFERAAAIRDQLQAIERVVEKQRVVFTSNYLDSDVIAMARSEKEVCVQVLFIRGGKLIGSEYFILEGTDEASDKSVLTAFIKQFYNQVPKLPKQVLLPHEVEEAKIIEEWLKSRSDGKAVRLLVPRKGEKKALIKMAAENAAENLAALRAQWQADRHRQTKALAELQEALGLERIPNRIECYDISNTMGTAITGSMVVFEQGVPNKAHYRRFNIRSVSGNPDDFASMEEVLKRRFRRWQAAKSVQKDPGKKTDRSFSSLPDLLIVDGGKGQLGRAVKVLEAYQLQGKVFVVGLAKQHEELFLPGRPDSIRLPRKSEGLFLLQRIRDEAHRFAITAHRKRREKAGMASTLDAIPGIGPARRKALLSQFGSVDAIRNASVEEIAAVPKMNRKLAGIIKEHLG